MFSPFSGHEDSRVTPRLGALQGVLGPQSNSAGWPERRGSAGFARVGLSEPAVGSPAGASSAAVARQPEQTAQGVLDLLPKLRVALSVECRRGQSAMPETQLGELDGLSFFSWQDHRGECPTFSQQ